MSTRKKTPRTNSKCPSGHELAAPICLQFMVFVDGMDGDVYQNWNAMTHGVTHAFKHGAKEVTIKKWPTANGVGGKN